MCLPIHDAPSWPCLWAFPNAYLSMLQFRAHKLFYKWPESVFSTLWPILSLSLELQCESSHMQTNRCGCVQIKLYLRNKFSVNNFSCKKVCWPLIWWITKYRSTERHHWINVSFIFYCFLSQTLKSTNSSKRTWNSDVNKGLLHTVKLRITAADRKILVFRADEDHCKETCCNTFRCVFYVPSGAKYFLYMDYLI